MFTKINEIQTTRAAPADVSMMKRIFRNIVLPGPGKLGRRLMNGILVSLLF